MICCCGAFIWSFRKNAQDMAGKWRESWWAYKGRWNVKWIVRNLIVVISKQCILTVLPILGCRCGVFGWRDCGSTFRDCGVAEESILQETRGYNGTAVSSSAINMQWLFLWLKYTEGNWMCLFTAREKLLNSTSNWKRSARVSTNHSCIKIVEMVFTSVCCGDWMTLVVMDTNDHCKI